MFRWDDLGATSVRFAAGGGGAGADPEAALHTLIDACAIPLVVHDYCRAGILGSATLVRHRGQPWLLTAAHLFDQAPRCGNWLAPAKDGELLALDGAIVRRAPGLDLAVIDLRQVKSLPRLLHGRHPVPLDEALAPATGRDTVYAVSGFPAAWSLFERGWLAARRLTVLTRRARHAGQRARHDRVYDYGHLGLRSDGQWIHTPGAGGHERRRHLGSHAGLPTAGTTPASPRFNRPSLCTAAICAATKPAPRCRCYKPSSDAATV